MPPAPPPRLPVDALQRACCYRRQRCERQYPAGPDRAERGAIPLLSKHARNSSRVAARLLRVVEPETSARKGKVGPYLFTGFVTDASVCARLRCARPGGSARVIEGGGGWGVFRVGVEARAREVTASLSATPYLKNLAKFSSLPLALGEKMREDFRDLTRGAHDDPPRTDSHSLARDSIRAVNPCRVCSASSVLKTRSPSAEVRPPQTKTLMRR